MDEQPRVQATNAVTILFCMDSACSLILIGKCNLYENIMFGVCCCLFFIAQKTLDNRGGNVYFSWIKVSVRDHRAHVLEKGGRRTASTLDHKRKYMLYIKTES